MKFLTSKQIHAYFDRVAGTVEQLSPHMRLARHPTEDQNSYDYAALLAMGVETLFAPMLSRQPKAHAALMALNPTILVGELTSTCPIGRETWTDDAFIGSGDRYIRLGADFRGASIAEVGEKSVVWFRYESLPPLVAEAYYRHATGLEVVHELPSVPLESRVLPAMLYVWLRADQVGGTGRKQMQAIEGGLTAVADPLATPRKDGVTWKSFACVLDSRAQNERGSVGDLLFVQERSPSQRVFHVHDGNFNAIRMVGDPVALYDEYVAWVFSGGSGRFDFCRHSLDA